VTQFTASRHEVGRAQASDPSPAVDTTRRRFLAAGAAGIAGLGTLGSASAAPDRHTLTIDGFGPPTTYSFTVGGDLEKSTAEGATIDRSDWIVDRSAHGAVANGMDAYTFTGALYSFDFDGSGEINVLLDGEPAHVGNRPDHTLVIDGFGTTTPYSFTIGKGTATQSDADGASVNDSDHTNDFGTSGAVRAGTDAYVYDGSLQSFDFDRSGEINVTIDGKAAHVGRRPDRTLTIAGDGEYTPYEFSVSGSIRGVIEIDEEQAIVDSPLVFGAVSGDGRDTYTYDGDLTELTYPDDRSPEIHSNDELVTSTGY
jgi:hypothetical protein